MDAYKGLARAFSSSTSTGPIALEDGIAVPADASAEPTTPPTPAPTFTLTLPSKLLLLISAVSFCAQQFVASGAVSMDRTLWENVGSAVMHVVYGLQTVEILFGVFLIFIWLTKNRQAPAGDAPVAGVDGSEKAVAVEEEKASASVV
ncbi:hypothetical protein B0H12DRAFT_1239179 [Mycena haematopus]|nr:hypothetical protein B0H12DRAFT_1239179 [Mycena haematopus]